MPKRQLRVQLALSNIEVPCHIAIHVIIQNLALYVPQRVAVQVIGHLGVTIHAEHHRLRVHLLHQARRRDPIVHRMSIVGVIVELLPQKGRLLSVFVELVRRRVNNHIVHLVHRKSTSLLKVASWLEINLDFWLLEAIAILGMFFLEQ